MSDLDIESVEFFLRLAKTKKPCLVAPRKYALDYIESMGLVKCVAEGVSPDASPYGCDRVRRSYCITPRGRRVVDDVRRAMVMVRLGGSGEPGW